MRILSGTPLKSAQPTLFYIQAWESKNIFNKCSDFESFSTFGFLPLIYNFQLGSYFRKWLNGSHPPSEYRKVYNMLSPNRLLWQLRVPISKFSTLACFYVFFIFENIPYIFVKIIALSYSHWSNQWLCMISDKTRLKNNYLKFEFH